MRVPAGSSAEVDISAEAVSRAAALSLIEAMLLHEEVPSPAAVLQARRNAEARGQLFVEFGGLSRVEVAGGAGSRAKNRAALAKQWKKAGRIFSVSHRGAELFPGFQFDHQGQPREVIREVVAILGDRSSWELALWFVSADGWLNGRRPVDLLDADSESVVVAARNEAAGVVF